MKTQDLKLGGPEFLAVSPEGTVTLSDSELLLNGDYARDGNDLQLTGADGTQLVIAGYFLEANPPDLMSSDGKLLSGETVALLAGPQAPAQYAQTTGGQFGEPIGQVESLNGLATAQRPDGLKVDLEVGSQVFQGDVISTSAGAAVGITFLDQSVFTIEDNATMVLNELVYNPGGTSNSMLFNLIGGSVAFVSGAIAKSGDVKIETPVAVMAIRGTTPYAACESASEGCVFGGEEGEYVLLHKILGKVLATVNDPSIIISLRSADASPIASSPNPDKQAAMQQLFQSLHNTVEILNERLEDGEGLIREAGTGSPDFPTSGFIESIAGFFKSGVTKLLGKEQANPEIADINGQLEQKINPQLIGNTDEDTSTIVEVITEDDILGLGPLATVIGAIVTSGLGEVSIRAGGLAVIYDPGTAYNHLAVGESAPVHISILIDLGDGTTLTEFARVTVEGVNDMPTANPDNAATGEGAAVTIDVLSNDTDPDNNDVLSISSATITAGVGEVTVSSDGKSLIYDPAGAFDFLSNDETGTVVITYQVTDSQGGSATGTATVVVSGSNTEPSITAADTSGTVTELPDGEGGENSAILTAEGAIAFTDTDLGDSHQATVLPSPGSFRGTLTAQVTDSATGDGSGQVTWLFSVSDADLEDLAATGKLLQNYTVRITDSSGAVITQVITITIQGSNDGPVLVGGTLQGAVTELTDNAPGEGTQVLQSSGNIAFFDADLTGSHSVAVAANGSGYLGSVMASVTSSSQIIWTYSVADGVLDYLAAGQSLTQSYTVTITDNTGASIIQIVTVTINGTNDGPVITSGPGTGSVSAQTGADDLTTNGSLNFADVDLNDTHTVSVDADGAGFRGALTAGVSNPSTGDGSGQISWAFLINNGDIEDLADGQVLTQTYTITVKDVNGATSTQKVAITIGGTNDTPVITGGPGTGAVTELPDGDAGENSLTLSASGTIGFTDLDLADTHTVSVSENGSGFLGTLSPTISNASLGDGVGQISWSFTVNDNDLDFLSVTDTLTQTYTLTLRDNNGATDTQIVTITINGSNDAPVITAADVSGGLTELADGAAGENSQILSVAGSFAFGDVDANDGHTASVAAIGAAPRGSLTAIVSGSNVLWTYTVNDGALDDLAQGDTVIQSYKVTVSDGHGGTDTRIVDISLTGTNDVAIITGKSTGLVIEDDEIDTISGLLKVEDPDIRQDGTREDAFKVVVIAGTYGTLTMAASGQWSYQLDSHDPDTSALSFSDTVSDNFTVSTIDGTTQEISVTVEGAGFDFEFSDFSGNSGSSQFKSLDAGTIQSVDIDLLITPMPLMVGDGSHINPNKVNAASFDIGVGQGQDIDSDEGLRFEFVTRAQAPSQNDIAALTYVSHIALVVFQAQIQSIPGAHGSDGGTASILIRIVNADDDKNFDSLGDDGSDANGEADVVVPLSIDDVTVGSASGVYTMQQFGDTVVISGLHEGDTFTVDSPTPFNRVEVENASDITSQGSEFELGVLGFNMAQVSTDPLNGGDGNDTLTSGAGQQVLTGGKGIDEFVFDGNMSTGALADIIADYQQGIDVIDLTALFDLAPGAFSEASVQEFARYISPNDNDGGSDPSGTTGDLFVDLDGAGTSQSFALVAHLNTAPDNVILKVDDGNEINYVTVI